MRTHANTDTAFLLWESDLPHFEQWRVRTHANIHARTDTRPCMHTQRCTMATSQKGVGIPIKLMHEAEGHVITVELKSGEMYRGELFDAEDNWNCQLKDVTATGRDGRVTQLDHIFVRGR